MQPSKSLVSFSIAKEAECPQISENHPGALTRWQATVAPIRGAARTIVSLCHTMSSCHTVSPCHYVTPCDTEPDQPIERCHCISISLHRELKVSIGRTKSCSVFVFAHLTNKPQEPPLPVSSPVDISSPQFLPPPCSAWRGCGQLWHTLAYFRNICEQDICRDIFRIFARIFPRNLQAAGKSVSEEGRYD